MYNHFYNAHRMAGNQVLLPTQAGEHGFSQEAGRGFEHRDASPASFNISTRRARKDQLAQCMAV